jgi:hypothetical protein
VEDHHARAPGGIRFQGLARPQPSVASQAAFLLEDGVHPVDGRRGVARGLDREDMAVLVPEVAGLIGPQTGERGRDRRRLQADGRRGARGLIGGYLGARLQTRLPERALRLLLGSLAIALAVLYLIQGLQPQRKDRAHQGAGPKDPPTETGEQGLGPKLALKRDHYQRSNRTAALSCAVLSLGLAADRAVPAPRRPPTAGRCYG